MSTKETMTLEDAAKDYQSAVKDLFALRTDGPALHERDIRKDQKALDAFNKLDSATKRLNDVLASQPAEQPRGEKYPAVFTGRLLGKHVGLHGSVDSVEALEAYIDAAAKLYTAQPKPEQDHSRDATKMIEQAVGDGVDEETTVRYCPECSHLGEVHSDCRDCCPDGSKARYIPVHIAEAAQRDFRASITPRPAVATPAEVTDEMVAVNRADLEALLECNRAAAQETTMSHSGIDFIEERGGAEAEDVIDRVAYHLYYSLFPAMRIRDSLESALTAQCQVRKDGQGVKILEHLLLAAKACADRLQNLCDTRLRGPECAEARAEYQSLNEAIRNGLVLHVPASPSAGAVVPEGWKLVPFEPTQAILDVLAWHLDEAQQGPPFFPRNVYAAMLAPAPEVPRA